MIAILMALGRTRSVFFKDTTGRPHPVATLHELYHVVLSASGRPPVVIDSADLMANPAGIMAAYCAAAGLLFSEQALSWHPGPCAEWSRSARWHAAMERTSTFTQLESSYQETVATNAKLAEFSAYHESYYQELRACRLVPLRSRA